MEAKIENGLLPRQINSYEIDLVKEKTSLQIFIYGMRGLGVEIAKNLILEGPKKITIYDNSVCTYADLGSNIFIHESDVENKNSRADASLNKLKELNNNVVIDTYKGELAHDFDIILEYNIIVISELIARETAENLNLFCRENKIGFIYCSCLGLSGFSFTDFGENFVTRDSDGEECKQYQVKNISQNNPGIVMIDTKDKKKLELAHGDFVSIKEIIGMNELNDTPPRPIRVLSENTFSIEDTSKFSEYISGGIVEQIKIPKPAYFKNLKESFENIRNDEYESFANFTSFKNQINLNKSSCRDELLHLAFISIHEFFNINHRLPYINNQEDIDKVIEYSKIIYAISLNKKRDWAINLNNIEEYVIRNVAKWARVNIAAVCSFLGGIISQEVIKFTTIYTPFNQWFSCDFYECLGTNGIQDLDNKKISDKKSKYQDQLVIFGESIQKNIAALNILMIGAGSLGNEFVKLFSSMGISTDQSSNLTIADDEIIQASNLNGQFLFNKRDIGFFRSIKCKDALSEINSNINCSTIQCKSSENSKELLEDEVFIKHDIIISTVNNMEIKRFIEKKCTFFHKYLIDCTSLGTKAYSQIIIPNETSSLNDTKNFIKKISDSSINNFPSLMENCGEWGRNITSEYFINQINELNEIIYADNNNDDEEENDDLIEEDDFEDARSNRLDKILKNYNYHQIVDKLINMKKLIEVAVSKNFDKCIELAVYNFKDAFEYKIKQLLITYPADEENLDGSKFWIGANRCPNPITIDLEDRNHVTFIVLYSVMIAKALNIESNQNFLYIKNYAENHIREEIIDYSIYPNNKIRYSLNNKSKEMEIEKQVRNLKVSLLNIIKKYRIFNNKKFNQLVNEEDDKYNYEEFLYAASQTRAQNYKYKETDFIKTNFMSGKVINTNSSTNACIAGLASLQIYSLLKGKNNSDAYNNTNSNVRNSFLNLGINLFLTTEPFKKEIIKDKYIYKKLVSRALPYEWTIWDKIEVKGSLTIKELSDFFINNFNITVNKILFDNGRFLIIKNLSEEMYFKLLIFRSNFNLEKYFLEFVCQNKNYKNNYIPFRIDAIDPDGIITYLPLIKYTF